MAYVYRHIRLDKNEPFYIGIGNNNKGNYRRSKDKYGRSNHWKSIVAITKYEVEIMLDDLTWEQACQKEIEFIKLYGRHDLGLGTLVNFTDGGEGRVGHTLTEETLRKLSNSKKRENLSEETIRKISESSKGRVLSEEARKKISDHHKGALFSEEHRRKISESRKNNPIFSGGNNQASVAILQISTGKIFLTMQDAANSIGANIFIFRNHVSGRRKTNRYPDFKVIGKAVNLKNKTNKDDN